MPASPSAVRWTDHALAKAQVLGIARADIEFAVLEKHNRRQRNAGAGGWKLRAGNIVIVYDHPDQGDPTVARLITLWRQR